jgi:hypothetical protein
MPTATSVPDEVGAGPESSGPVVILASFGAGAAAPPPPPLATGA